MTEWLSPFDWTTGDQVHAARLNWVRDNLNHLYEDASLSHWEEWPHTVDPSNMANAYAGVSVANYSHYGRISGSRTITNLHVYVGLTSGNIGVAVYTNSLAMNSARPLTRLGTSGAIACPAVGTATIALGASIPVVHGDHWFALSANNTTATFGCSNFIFMGGPWTQGLHAVEAAAHPPPATATIGEYGGTGFLMMGS